MKKIFGVLSLIAVLMVAFSSNAIASVADDVSVEYAISYDSPDFVAVATADALSIEYVTIGEDFVRPDIGSSGTLPTSELSEFSTNVSAESESYISKGDADSVNIVAGFSNTHLPIEVGLLTETLSTNKYVSTNDKHGYEVSDIIKRISSNIGKLTTFNLSS